MAKLIKITSLVYSATAVLFFLIANIAAGFIVSAKEQYDKTGVEVEFGSLQMGCIVAVNVLVYVLLFGYFAILFEVAMYFLKKNRLTRMRQPIPESEKFPTIPFVVGFVFFLLFMSVMQVVL